jgi:uncharacterized damage-inducible protein DinB
MTSAYFDTLLRHHAWTVKRLLETAALVTAPELETETLSHGSLLATLRHVADVDQSWGRVVLGETPLDITQIEEQLDDLPSLRAFWLAEASRLAEFVRALPAAGLERDVQPPMEAAPLQDLADRHPHHDPPWRARQSDRLAPNRARALAR